jgi:hypothetical protein
MREPTESAFRADMDRYQPPVRIVARRRTSDHDLIARLSIATACIAIGCLCLLGIASNLGWIQ